MENGWHVEVSFPSSTNSIVAIKSRIKWDISACKTSKLIEALCYELKEYYTNDSSESYVVTLNKKTDKGTSVQLGCLLDEAASLKSIRLINEKLGYGVILFSSEGELIAASKAMLATAQMRRTVALSPSPSHTPPRACASSRPCFQTSTHPPISRNLCAIIHKNNK